MIAQRPVTGALHREIAACTLCAPHLPLGPKPIVQFSATSRIAIVGQAPGRITHHSGIPFDDAAGERLAGWLGVSEQVLHDPAQIAIVSMGFCYPGKASGGDAPPRRECAPQWHERVFAAMPQRRLTLLVGAYAQSHYLPHTRKLSMTERVETGAQYAPFVPLPHPAWRVRMWMERNPWFEGETLPALRRAVAAALA